MDFVTIHHKVFQDFPGIFYDFSRRTAMIYVGMLPQAAPFLYWRSYDDWRCPTGPSHSSFSQQILYNEDYPRVPIGHSILQVTTKETSTC